MEKGRDKEGKRKKKEPYKEKLNVNAKKRYLDKLITIINVDLPAKDWIAS